MDHSLGEIPDVVNYGAVGVLGEMGRQADGLPCVDSAGNNSLGHRWGVHCDEDLVLVGQPPLVLDDEEHRVHPWLVPDVEGHIVGVGRVGLVGQEP